MSAAEPVGIDTGPDATAVGEDRSVAGAPAGISIRLCTRSGVVGSGRPVVSGGGDHKRNAVAASDAATVGTPGDRPVTVKYPAPNPVVAVPAIPGPSAVRAAAVRLPEFTLTLSGL